MGVNENSTYYGNKRNVNSKWHENLMIMILIITVVVTPTPIANRKRMTKQGWHRVVEMASNKTQCRTAEGWQQIASEHRQKRT